MGAERGDERIEKRTAELSEGLKGGESIKRQTADLFLAEGKL